MQLKAEAEEKDRREAAAEIPAEEPAAEPAESEHAEPEGAEPGAETPEEPEPEAPEPEVEPETPEPIAAEAAPEEDIPVEAAEDVEVAEDERAEPPADTDVGAAAEEEEAAPRSDRVRRTLDDAVKNVLREEAERETRARRAEGSALESQPELGIAAAIGAAAALTGGEEPDRVVRVRGDENDLDDDALVSRSSRRELLPDIEEINSTLRATSERDGEPAAIDAPETVARRRSGFRMGFSTALLIAVILLGLYLLAPTIAARVPAAEPILNTYVSGVDAARSWLDGQMKSLTQSLNGGANGG